MKRFFHVYLFLAVIITYMISFFGQALSCEFSSSLYANYKRSGGFSETQVVVGALPEVQCPFFEGKVNSDFKSIYSLRYFENSGFAMNGEINEGDGKQAFGFYRAELRLFTDSSELKVGRQKISFGPAKLLRSLGWFESESIFDPLGFVEGVDAVLVRQYFESNASIWGWGVYADGKPPSSANEDMLKGKPQYGGRYMGSFQNTEYGFSFHTGEIRFTNIEGNVRTSESRLKGFDIHVDWYLGSWLEWSILEFGSDDYGTTQSSQVTIGSDYTFEHGVHALLEIQNTNISSVYQDTQYLISQILQMSYAATYSQNLRFTLLNSDVSGSSERMNSIILSYREVFDEWFYEFQLTNTNGSEEGESLSRSRKFMEQKDGLGMALFAKFDI